MNAIIQFSNFNFSLKHAKLCCTISLLSSLKSWLICIFDKELKACSYKSLPLILRPIWTVYESTGDKLSASKSQGEYDGWTSRKKEREEPREGELRGKKKKSLLHWYSKTWLDPRYIRANRPLPSGMAEAEWKQWWQDLMVWLSCPKGAGLKKSDLGFLRVWLAGEWDDASLHELRHWSCRILES